jgi:hypothetical protein
LTSGNKKTAKSNSMSGIVRPATTDMVKLKSGAHPLVGLYAWNVQLVVNDIGE